MGKATKLASTSQTSSPSIQATPLVYLAHGRSPSPGRKAVDPAPVTMSNTVSMLPTQTRPVKHSYFIELTEAADMNEHLKWMENQLEKYSNTEHQCKVVQQYGSVLKAYLAKLSGPALSDVKNHPDVKLVAQDAEGTLFAWQGHADMVPLEGQLNVKTGLSPDTPLFYICQ